MPLVTTPASHLDHGLSPEAIAWLPTEFGEVDCALHGPAMGDPPVPESDTFYVIRKGRGNYSRVCERPMRKTRTVTVIAGPNDGQPCVLYTAFGGPLAPKETGDSTLKPEEREKSAAFWAEHALTHTRVC